MNTRIKEVRTTNHLSQAAFAARIGLSASGIGMIERGYRTPQETTLRIICQTFGVSYTWLKTGEGNMMDAPAPDPAAALLAVLRRIPQEDRAALKDALVALLGSI